ncbi:MAG: PEP-CTERM sorting domain-containing protein [Burkholderiales bacterium]|nr:PEP-CTERM sorting domain-containing protein [Burkholderiales bacterium]
MRRSLLLASAVAAFACAQVTQAGVVQVMTPITVFDGTGTGSVPLASDPGNALGDSVDGYGFVDATATISASPTESSGGVTTIGFDVSTLMVSVSSVFTLHLDLALEDADARAGRDFATGSPVTPTRLSPLVIEIAGELDLLALLDALAALPGDATEAEQYNAILAAAAATATVTHTITDAKYALGVDVNGNGTSDVMTLGTTDLDTTALELDFTDGDLEALVTAILDGTLTDPLVIEAGVSVAGLGLTFMGDVFDETADPPFSISFVDVTIASDAASVPEPSSLPLLLAAGLGLILLARRRAR